VSDLTVKGSLSAVCVRIAGASAKFDLRDRLAVADTPTFGRELFRVA
jgi:hypothetical protein